MGESIRAKVTAHKPESVHSHVLEAMCQRNGDYVVTVHQGRIVKVARVKRPVYVDQIVENGDIVFEEGKTGS